MHLSGNKSFLLFDNNRDRIYIQASLRNTKNLAQLNNTNYTGEVSWASNNFRKWHLRLLLETATKTLEMEERFSWQ